MIQFIQLVDVGTICSIVFVSDFLKSLHLTESGEVWAGAGDEWRRRRFGGQREWAIYRNQYISYLILILMI